MTSNSVDVDYPDMTAFHVAASERHLDIVRYLLDNGADVHLQDTCGNTALHCARANGVVVIVTALLGAGSSETYQNQAGLTADARGLRVSTPPNVACIVSYEN